MALKIYENLFTGPFNINTYQYKKNKKPTIILVILKEGKNYAPTFYAVKTILTDKKDIFSFEEFINRIKKKLIIKVQNYQFIFENLNLQTKVKELSYLLKLIKNL